MMYSNTEDGMGNGQFSGGTGASTAQSEESVISVGLKVVGNLESDGDVVIAGTVEGDITSRGLTVSQGASVKGSISAEVVTILGRVEGQVKARSVGIAKSGEMTGDIEYGSLAIEDGAVLEGNCRRTKAASEARVSKLKAVEGGAVKSTAASGKSADEAKSEAG